MRVQAKNTDPEPATAAQAPAPPAGAAEPPPLAPAGGQPTSALEPLAERLFRLLWAASIVSNVGTWMQNVGGAWLMTELTPSPVLVALMQTATSLPIFLAGLPAGALADILDRRRLLLMAQTWMLVVAAALGGLTLVGLMNPWLLLTFTFALGVGSAFNAPAWQAVIPEIVSWRRMPAAVTLESAGFNLARAVGPAAGGLIVAWVGLGANFMLNAASFLATIFVLYRWKRARRTSHVPGERLVSATRAGLRYARNAPELHAVLVRTVAFILCASTLWALLPLVARRAGTAPEWLRRPARGAWTRCRLRRRRPAAPAGRAVRGHPDRRSISCLWAGDAGTWLRAESGRPVRDHGPGRHGLDGRHIWPQRYGAGVRTQVGQSARAGNVPARVSGNTGRRQPVVGVRRGAGW